MPIDASNAICNVSCDGEYGIITCQSKGDLWDKAGEKIAMMDTKMNVTILNEEGSEDTHNIDTS